MSAAPAAAVRRFCRAAKRAHDRATRLLAMPGTGLGTLQADAVYHARQRVAARAWRGLPSNLRAVVRNPLGE